MELPGGKDFALDHDEELILNELGKPLGSKDEYNQCKEKLYKSRNKDAAKKYREKLKQK